MGLSNITIPEHKIVIGHGHVTVRGISLSDLMVIVNVYGPQATLAFNEIQKGGSLQSSDVRLLIGTLAKEFPDMVAAAMALAADSYNAETVEVLKRIPFNKQLEIIEAIFDATFPNEGEVKKLMESLTKMLTEVSGALTEVRLPSSIGIGGSGAQ